MSNDNTNDKSGADPERTETLADSLAAVWGTIVSPEGPNTAGKASTAAAEAVPAPVVWLLGKVQAGKSSIVRALTRSPEAEVGCGFRPCTNTARLFDYPDGVPIIRFLDTRGLGEIGYDMTEDLAFAEQHGHLLLVVMRARDQGQAEIVQVVEDVRRRKPDWPVVVAQTTLHEAYPPGKEHVLPYPFQVGGMGDPLCAAPSSVPEDLARSLTHQRRLFQAVKGRGPLLFVPVDLTHAQDGYAPLDYGLDALENALSLAAPAALAAALDTLAGPDNDMRAARAHPHIVGYALAAGAVDAVPVAGAVAVPGVQAKLLHSLARIYGVDWDRRTLVEFAGCLGSSVLGRMLASFGIRQATKLVPVYGQTIGAAASAATGFATTYALGKAACYFLARRRAGASIVAGEVARTYTRSLEAAFRMARDRQPGSGGGKAGQ